MPKPNDGQRSLLSSFTFRGIPTPGYEATSLSATSMTGMHHRYVFNLYWRKKKASHQGLIDVLVTARQTSETMSCE